MSIEERIRKRALQLGFTLAGITHTGPVGQLYSDSFSEWIADGASAGMEYMSRNTSVRLNPSELLRGGRSVICAALAYSPGPKDSSPEAGNISVYARYGDYHRFVKKKLFALAEYIKEQTAENARFRACVDSAPVMERVLAVRAGLGFIGKNHMLINPRFGCQLFLGELFTTVELKPDSPLEHSCLDCKKCLEACPAGALSAEGGFDARRCVSYLTIEHKGPIPSEMHGAVSGKLYGCDICSSICPYQQNAEMSETGIKYRPELKYIEPGDVMAMNEKDFKRLFAGTPVERTGLERLKRNAEISLKNKEA